MRKSVLPIVADPLLIQRSKCPECCCFSCLIHPTCKHASVVQNYQTIECAWTNSSVKHFGYKNKNRAKVQFYERNPLDAFNFLVQRATSKNFFSIFKQFKSYRKFCTLVNIENCRELITVKRMCRIWGRFEYSQNMGNSFTENQFSRCV